MTAVLSSFTKTISLANFLFMLFCTILAESTCQCRSLLVTKTFVTLALKKMLSHGKKASLSFFDLLSELSWSFLLHEKETYPTALALLSPFFNITVDFYDIAVYNTYIFLHVLLTQGRRALKYKPIIKGG